MGLFSNHNEPAQTQPAQPPVSPTDSTHRRGLFGSRHSRDSSATSPEHLDRSSTTTSRTSTSSNHPNLLHRLGGHKEDPSITAARQRVLSAEQAERDADRALAEARTAVNAAREHVKMLEREAAEEARLAKIKMGMAKDISKRAAPLGRHDVK